MTHAERYTEVYRYVHVNRNSIVEMNICGLPRHSCVPVQNLCAIIVMSIRVGDLHTIHEGHASHSTNSYCSIVLHSGAAEPRSQPL